MASDAQFAAFGIVRPRGARCTGAPVRSCARSTARPSRSSSRMLCNALSGAGRNAGSFRNSSGATGDAHPLCARSREAARVDIALARRGFPTPQGEKLCYRVASRCLQASQHRFDAADLSASIVDSLRKAGESISATGARGKEKCPPMPPPAASDGPWELVAPTGGGEVPAAVCEEALHCLVVHLGALEALGRHDGTERAAPVVLEWLRALTKREASSAPSKENASPSTPGAGAAGAGDAASSEQRRALLHAVYGRLVSALKAGKRDADAAAWMEEARRLCDVPPPEATPSSRPAHAPSRTPSAADAGRRRRRRRRRRCKLASGR